MIDEDLFSRLKALSPNVYPFTAPKGFSMPCVLFQPLDEKPVQDLISDPDCAFVWVQVKTIDVSFSAAKRVAHKIRQSLLSDWQSESIQNVTWLGDAPYLDDTTETPVYCVASRYVIFTDV